MSWLETGWKTVYWCEVVSGSIKVIQGDHVDLPRQRTAELFSWSPKVEGDLAGLGFLNPLEGTSCSISTQLTVKFRIQLFHTLGHLPFHPNTYLFLWPLALTWFMDGKNWLKTETIKWGVKALLSTLCNGQWTVYSWIASRKERTCGCRSP